MQLYTYIYTHTHAYTLFETCMLYIFVYTIEDGITATLRRFPFELRGMVRFTKDFANAPLGGDLLEQLGWVPDGTERRLSSLGKSYENMGNIWEFTIIYL